MHRSPLPTTCKANFSLESHHRSKTATYRLAVDAGVLDRLQGEDLEDLVLLGVGDVQVSVGGGDGQIVLIGDLSGSGNLKMSLL
jgi:hypothetical protein